MHTISASPAVRGSLRARMLRALRRYWPLYLMAIPGMLYFVIYKIVPIFGTVIAFKNFTIKEHLARLEKAEIMQICECYKLVREA